MIERETCAHCQYRNQPNGCDGCLVPTVYEVMEERERKFRDKEARAAGRRRKAINLAKKMGKIKA